jgi:hypothetical protein
MLAASRASVATRPTRRMSRATSPMAAIVKTFRLTPDSRSTSARARWPPRIISHTQLQFGFMPASSNLRTVLMSPCRSAAANLAAGPTGRPSRERSRCRRRALVHARHVRANPSGVCAEPLNAAADKLFRHAGHFFLAIMSDAIIRRMPSSADRAGRKSMPWKAVLPARSAAAPRFGVTVPSGAAGPRAGRQPAIPKPQQQPTRPSTPLGPGGTPRRETGRWAAPPPGRPSEACA